MRRRLQLTTDAEVEAYEGRAADHRNLLFRGGARIATSEVWWLRRIGLFHSAGCGS